MPSIDSALQEFLLSCEADGLAPATLTWYRSLLERFTRFTPADSLQEVDAHQLREYMVSLRKEGFTDHTISDHNRALHRFWKWCGEEYQISNPMRNLKFIQPPDLKQPKAVNLEDVIAMFRAAENGQAVERDQAILAFALDTGARAGGDSDPKGGRPGHPKA
jgi:site-specific recombinase XerD